MAFVNPEILQKIFGGAQQLGQTLGSAPQSQQQQLHQALMGAGAGMSQAAAQPGASFGQALGGGASGMMQGQQQAQQMQLNQLKMQQAQAEMERQERISKIMGDILQPRRPDFASQVATGGVQTPQIGPAQTAPLQQEANVQATRFAGPPDAQRWEALFPELKANVIRTESGGRQFGDDGQTLTSSAGAQGLMQIMPGTGPDAAELAGLPWDPERMANDPKYNEQLGTAYLNHLGGRYSGDPVLASAAYNWGMGRVDSLIDKVGDPRKGEISHEEWVQAIPVEEARNYAANVGLPLVQGGGQSQAQPVAQPQQAPLNGYQQRALEQQANDPLAGLPAGTRQMLALLPPEDAAAAVVELQTRAPAEQPAAVREALFIAGGDTELARRIMASNMSKDDIPVFMQQIDAIKAANPGITHQAAVNHVLNVTDTSVSPNTGRVTRTDNIRGVATEVPVQPGQDLPEPQARGPSAWELVQNTNVTGIGSGAVELGNRTLSQLGFNVGEDTVTARQYMRQLETDIVRAFQESPRFAEGERQQILKELNLGPNILRDESTLRAGLRSSASSLQSRLDRYSRMAADTGLGETTRRDAAEKAAVIESALDRIGVPVEQRFSRGEIIPGGGGPQADEVNDLINRWAD